MNIFETFIWGFIGSFIIDLYGAFQGKNSSKKYKTSTDWIVVVLLAIVAGFMAVAYNIDNRLLALQIGASTPLLLNKLKSPIQK